MNCRFKSLLSPYDVLIKSHRNIPNFYKPLNVKPLTKIGFNSGGLFTLSKLNLTITSKDDKLSKDTQYKEVINFKNIN